MDSKNLNKQFNIPAWVKGNSIAEEAQSIMKKFEGRNSKADKDTLKSLMDSLMKKQEYVKMQIDASMKANSTEVPDMMNGQVPPEMQNQAAFGNLFGGDGAQLNATNDAGVNMSTGLDQEQMSAENSIKGAAGSASGFIAAGAALSNFGREGAQALGGNKAGDYATGILEPHTAFLRKDVPESQKLLGLAMGGDPLIMGHITAKANKKLRSEQGDKNTKRALLGYRHDDYAFGGLMSPDPTKKSLGSKDIKSIKNSTGIEFTDEGANKLFYKNNSFVKPDYSKDINLGPFKGLDYFNISKNGDEYILNPTKKNIRGPEAHKESINRLRKLNPNLKFADSTYVPMSNRMAYGGMTNKYAYGTTNPDPVPDVKSDIDANALIQNPLVVDPNGYAKQYEGFTGDSIGPMKTTAGNNEASTFGKAGKWLGNNYGSIMRLAPIIGNLTDKIKKPVTDPGTRLDNVYVPQLFDTASAINRVNSINTAGSAKASSAGNLGSYASNRRAGDIMKLRALGDEFQKGQEINRQENRIKHQFDLRKDITNAQLQESYIDRRARDLGAYETAKSEKRAAIFEDIGKIGKEETYKKMAKEMFGYTWNGKYFVDKKGNKVANEVVYAEIEKAQKDGEENKETKSKKKDKSTYTGFVGGGGLTF